ncbi:MAG: hypothetical protein PQJ44_00025 [Sphaerochaetaceae bacterium]|nr:hypothetical protein [Sphaerochaetaceae bacterium]
MKYDKNKTLNKKKEYDELFPSNNSNNKNQTNINIRKESLEKALDIRKFEIDLYWKRATYFWTFIAVVFTSYFLVLRTEGLDESYKFELLFILSFFGLFLSTAWFFANRGSKFWQENWEKHVDLLENDIIGPLYKTTLNQNRSFKLWLNPTHSYGFSVGKINQLVSFAISLLWGYIFIRQIAEIFSIKEPFPYFNYIILGLGAMILFILLFFMTVSSDTNGGDFKMKNRKIKL